MTSTVGNSEVQRLMHDVGIKVNMNYGCAASGGSSASGGTVPSVLKTSFGFGSANHASYYADPLRDNIHDHLWPVLLEGCNDQTNAFLGIWYRYSNCHEWVCDGTDEMYISMCNDGQLYGYGYLSFHMNWGWHEVNAVSDYNGWFVFDDWTISGAGSGGSDLNFQYAQDMTTEIHP